MFDAIVLPAVTPEPLGAAARKPGRTPANPVALASVVVFAAQAPRETLG
jgi:hypothetical protein